MTDLMFPDEIAAVLRIDRQKARRAVRELRCAVVMLGAKKWAVIRSDLEDAIRAARRPHEEEVQR